MEHFIVPQFSWAVSALTPVPMWVNAKHLSGCFFYGSNFDIFESFTVVCKSSWIPDDYPTFLVFVDSSKSYAVISLVADDSWRLVVVILAS
jgi:hypothetical protein